MKSMNQNEPSEAFSEVGRNLKKLSEGKQDVQELV